MKYDGVIDLSETEAELEACGVDPVALVCVQGPLHNKRHSWDGSKTAVFEVPDKVNAWRKHRYCYTRLAKGVATVEFFAYAGDSE